MRKLFAGIVLVLAAGCGSYDQPAPAPTAPTPPAATAPPGPPTITITADGVSPKEVTVPVGGRVIFVNNDRIPHDIAGGADLTSHDCVEIDAVGFLTPRRSGQTAQLPRPRACDFHDHGFHSPLFTGKIHTR